MRCSEGHPAGCRPWQISGLPLSEGGRRHELLQCGERGKHQAGRCQQYLGNFRMCLGAVSKRGKEQKRCGGWGWRVPPACSGGGCGGRRTISPMGVPGGSVIGLSFPAPRPVLYFFSRPLAAPVRVPCGSHSFLSRWKSPERWGIEQREAASFCPHPRFLKHCGIPRKVDL